MTNFTFIQSDFRRTTSGDYNIFFDEKYDFHTLLNHTKRKTDQFPHHVSMTDFLDENTGINIFLTYNEGVKPFEKIDDGFIINMTAYLEFCDAIKSKGKGRTRAFLSQNVNIKNASFTDEERDLFIAQNTTEKNISEIIKLLPTKVQMAILSELQNKIGSTGKFDFKSNAEGIFLEIGNIENREIIIEQLKKLEQNNFANIESALSISKIDQVLEIWVENKENKSEEFWQKLFETHNWILSQVFSAPTIFIKGKPYCGGKSPENSGGVMSDLWYRNLLTGVSTFIEIKTPKTDIIGAKYRGKEEGENNVIYGMSNELTGGIIQVSNQREVAISEFGRSGEVKIHNAKSLLIIGIIPEDEDQKKSFSLFRNSNKDVEIITFDELIEKINLLKKIYE